MREKLVTALKWLVIAAWTFGYEYFMAQMLRLPMPSIAAALSTFSQLRPV